MNLNLDDPLAGILSDGSDDSFFDDDILGKKKPTKKKTTPIASKKSSLFDLGDSEKPKTSESKKDALFDLGGDTRKISEEYKTAAKPITSSAPLKRSFSKESFKIPPAETKPKPLAVLKSPAKSKVSASADKLDILSGLGSEKKEFTKTLEKGKSSQSIIDDILGGSSAKTGGSSQVTRPQTATKSQDFDFDSFLGKPESKPSSKTAPLKQAPKVDVLKEEEKPKQETVAKKKASDDWLGIFHEKDNTTNEDDTGMPSWLGGGDSKMKKPDDKKTKLEPPKEIPREEPESEKATEIEEQQPEITIQSTVEQLAPKITSNVLQGSSEDITAEGAALYFQQQESQLMVAMQLKAQEERLVAMQMRQKESQRVHREAALAHHVQLDTMLQKQALQRQEMQAIISAHQQRISERIKALLGTTTNFNADNEDNTNVNEEFEIHPPEERETPHTKEKKQLLQLVQSLQENHDKEIDLMESSYRRQLAFLEVSLHQCEGRMKEESDKLIKYYTEKIHWLEDHHKLYKNMTEENLNSLTDRHKEENEMIRQQHLENIRILQEHYAVLMENIKNAVNKEQVLIQDSAGFSSDLHELVTDVRENKLQCQQLVERVQTLAENTQRENDRNVQIRETQINDMMHQLKKERDNFESEKIESRELVKMLETRLKQMTTMIEEESAALKQKKMEFEFEKATFSKQTEFAKNILKKQDEEIKTLREDIQKEYNEKTAMVEEEKSKTRKDSATIAKEKASIQSLKQDLEKMKAELEAQLEEVTEERSKLNVEKQQLHMEEQRILAKSRDYDLLAKTAIDKQSQADKKYSEAEFLQRKYEERIRRIQEHVVSLNAREKQIAREKVTLSRERLSLHNERKQSDSRQQCSLCKSMQNIPDYNLPSYALPESFLNVPVSRDYRNVDKAMNNIERDIASLMSRNYSLRYSTDVGNSVVSDAKYQSVETAQVEADPFKDLMDPKFMMLRLDVQKVLSNLDHSKKEDVENYEAFEHQGPDSAGDNN